LYRVADVRRVSAGNVFFKKTRIHTGRKGRKKAGAK